MCLTLQTSLNRQLIKKQSIDTKKDMGVSTSRPPQVSGSRIAYTQRIDNTDSPRHDAL